MNTTITRRTRARSLAAVAVLVTALTAVAAGAAVRADAAAAAAASETAAPADRGPAVDRRSLATARAATARYHRVEAAYADGYEQVSPCVEEPGLGAMGAHFVNHDRLVDGVIDPAAPEALLYVPGPDGLELVGIEYVQVDADQDVATDDDRPSVFGVPFDGPMEGHGPGEPVHYDLHVWLWKHNPAGLTAPFNPSLSCAS